MKRMMNWLMEEESGQGMVEYGLILALISVVVVVILGAIGTNLNTKFTTVNNAID